MEEFCHVCGEISVCTTPQKCPCCGARDAMSGVDDEARARAWGRGTPGTRHPAPARPHDDSDKNKKNVERLSCEAMQLMLKEAAKVTDEDGDDKTMPALEDSDDEEVVKE